MVSTADIIAVCVTLFVTLILPVLVLIVYGIKNRGKGVWSAWFLGAAGFFFFQLILRVPILSMITGIEAVQLFIFRHYLLYCLIMAFTAGLFEVAGRYIVARILKKNGSFERGVAAGLGHGGIESMMIVGMTYINNIIYIILINTGSFDQIVEQTKAMGQDTAALEVVRQTLIQGNSYLYYLAGYERVLTMIFHVAMSLLVCCFVWKGKDIAGILLCLALHTAVDFVAPVIQGMASGYVGKVYMEQNIAYAVIYIFLTLVAAGSLVLICRLRRKIGQKQSVS